MTEEIDIESAWTNITQDGPSGSQTLTASRDKDDPDNYEARASVEVVEFDCLDEDHPYHGDDVVTLTSEHEQTSIPGVSKAENHIYLDKHDACEMLVQLYEAIHELD